MNEIHQNVEIAEGLKVAFSKTSWSCSNEATEIISLFTWSKQKWLFEEPAFMQPIRAI